MDVILINSGNDAGIGGNANAQSYPPLGIISLASALKRHFGDRLEVTLLDGQIDDMSELLRVIKSKAPGLVGVSMYCTSIRNSVRLVREAKNCGAVTVMGNDHAAFHYRTLLNTIREIDFVCLEDVGETCLVALMENILQTGSGEGTDGFAWVRKGRVVAGGRSVGLRYLPSRVGATVRGRPGASRLDLLGIPRRDLLAKRYWDEYLRRFQVQFHSQFDPNAVGGVATINRARGCARSKRPCRYCGIADLTPRGSSPEVFWQDVRAAREQVAADYLYEAFDSATSWPKLLRSWVEARPSDLTDTRFFMYAQAAETNEVTVELFKSLGVACVNTGFDSGDTKALRLLKGESDSEETNRRAAKMWSEASIEIHTSFVLVGLGNESLTRRSLDKTLEFAQWLARDTTTVSLDSAMLYPDKSSLIGRWVWDTALAAEEAVEMGWDFIDFSLLEKVSGRWRDEVFIDLVELCGDFAKVCGVSAELLAEYSNEIEKIAAGVGMNFGQSQGGEAGVKTELDIPSP